MNMTHSKVWVVALNKDYLVCGYTFPTIMDVDYDKPKRPTYLKLTSDLRFACIFTLYKDAKAVADAIGGEIIEFMDVNETRKEETKWKY